MRRRIAYLLLALGAAAALGGCGSTSDRPLQTTLQALKVKASQPSSSSAPTSKKGCSDLRDSLRPPAVMPAPVGSEEDGTPSRLDAIGDEDERFALIDDRATIFAAAMCLPERERRILFLRFGEDLTQSEIAERVGVSQMQVSRLLRRSLQRLRDLTDDRQPKLKR
jgi:RNA polymerase sigma factor (sigma-70 family)